MSGYTGKDMFKQLEEVMKKCDNLSLEIKTQKIHYEEKINKLENRVTELECENKKLKDDNDRLKKYKENHLMFLYDFNVPFDNNLSERDLRHVKVKQKISGYFNSFNGIKNYLNVKSIIGTLKKQGKNFYKEIFNIYEEIPVEI